MTNLPVIGGLAGVILLVALLIARHRQKKSPPVARGRGPVRFSRESMRRTGLDSRPQKTRPQSSASGGAAKTAGLYAVAAALIAWVVLSYLTKAESGEAPAAAPEAKAEAAPAAPQAELSAVLSGRLEPPPPPGSEEAAASEASAAAALASLAPAESQAPAPNQAQANAAYGAFAPIEQASPLSTESMVLAAQAMAPNISRMEPVGRRLALADEVPRAKPQQKPRARLTDPPAGGAPNPPLSPALSGSTGSAGSLASVGSLAAPASMSDAAASAAAAAPAPAPAPPRPSSASSGQGRRYTVLAGSFGKSENAERLREKFLAAGLDVQVNEVTVNNKKYFRVMSGTFDDQASAEAYGRELKQRDLVDSAYIKPM